MTHPLFNELSDVKAETRECSKCGETKPLEIFAYRGYNKDRSKQYKHYCVPCENKERKRVMSFKKQYGPIDEWNQKCCSCEKTKKEKLEELKRTSSGGGIYKNKKIWLYDHDHDTGEFRGIICQPCNIMLGAGAINSKENLKKGAEYLERCNQ